MKLFQLWVVLYFYQDIKLSGGESHTKEFKEEAFFEVPAADETGALEIVKEKARAKGKKRNFYLDKISVDVCRVKPDRVENPMLTALKRAKLAA